MMALQQMLSADFYNQTAMQQVTAQQMYQNQLAQMQMQNVPWSYAGTTFSSFSSAGATVPAPVAAKPSPGEFTWLRERVAEVCWR